MLSYRSCLELQGNISVLSTRIVKKVLYLNKYVKKSTSEKWGYFEINRNAFNRVCKVGGVPQYLYQYTGKHNVSVNYAIVWYHHRSHTISCTCTCHTNTSFDSMVMRWVRVILYSKCICTSPAGNDCTRPTDRCVAHVKYSEVYVQLKKRSCYILF